MLTPSRRVTDVETLSQQPNPEPPPSHQILNQETQVKKDAKTTPTLWLKRGLAFAPAFAVLIVLMLGAWVAWSGAVMAPDIQHEAFDHANERRERAAQRHFERLKAGLPVDTLRIALVSGLANNTALRSIVMNYDEAKASAGESRKATKARRERLVVLRAGVVAERLVDLVRVDTVLTVAAASLASEKEGTADDQAAERGARKAVAAVEGKGLNEARDSDAAGIAPQALRAVTTAGLRAALREYLESARSAGDDGDPAAGNGTPITSDTKPATGPQEKLQNLPEPAADRLQRRVGARVAWGTGVFGVTVAILACLVISVVVILDVMATWKARLKMLFGATVVTV